MTRAYQEIYLSKAQASLADAFDYAVNACHIPGADFIKLFVASSISKRMENGEPSLLVGKSGIEIAIDVVLETTGKLLEKRAAGTSRAVQGILDRLGGQLLSVGFGEKLQRDIQCLFL